MARASSPMSYERGSKPKRPSFPRSRTSVPGFSRSASHGWLNQVTLIAAVSSATRATIRVRRRPRIGRFSTLRTRPLITHLLALAKRGDGDLVRGRLVAPRPVLEDVANSREPELAELPLRRRGDAGERVEAELEALRPQGTRRRRPGPGLVQACKDRLSTGGCHRSRHRAR